MAEEVVDAGSGGHLGALNKELKDILSSMGDRVRDQVRKHLVDQELDRRTKLVLGGIEKRKELQIVVQKIKPDQVAVHPNGEKEETYSAARWKELTDAKEKLKKMDEALDKALGNADYEGLKKLLG